MTESDRRHRLDGLEPDNLLGFLALLGLLRALETAEPDWHPRAAWDLANPPLRPVLVLMEPQSREAVCAAAAEGIARLAAFHDFGDTTDIKVAVGTARELCLSIVERAKTGGRYFADLCAALFCDSATDQDREKVEPTFLAYPSVATSNFLKNFKAISQASMPEKRPRDRSYPKNPAECMFQALFMPWNRLDRPVGLRWDPDEAKRHALQWRAPTKDPPTTQHGANRLAIIGLSVFTAAPINLGARVSLSILGGAGGGDRFSLAWPIWIDSASLATIRALLSHPQLREPHALDYLGVDHVRVARRISVDRLRNFTTAIPLEAEDNNAGPSVSSR